MFLHNSIHTKGFGVCVEIENEVMKWEGMGFDMKE
jgi:ATP-dependent Clp protease adapter protein ClpS